MSARIERPGRGSASARFGLFVLGVDRGDRRRRDDGATAMTDNRLTVDESIELVRRAQDIERKAKAQHARLIAERDGWQQIAKELAARRRWAMTPTAFGVPPMEFTNSTQLLDTVRPNLAQWWANLTFKDSERRSKRELWREKTAVVENALNMRRIQRAAATNVSVQPASCPRRSGGSPMLWTR
jgi:hypothetical protein